MRTPQSSWTLAGAYATTTALVHGSEGTQCGLDGRRGRRGVRGGRGASVCGRGARGPTWGRPMRPVFTTGTPESQKRRHGESNPGLPRAEE